MITKHFHRRNLPHLYYNEGMYFVTYRLKNSIHSDVLKRLHLPLQNLNTTKFNEIFKEYDSILDKSSNAVHYLNQPEIMEICKSSLHYYDGKEYKLICYCIMPNHIHIVLELISNERYIGDIIGSIKKYSARRANNVLHKKGAFWQAESFDRLIRDETELYFIIKYVLLNPVNAGLIENWREWKGTYCIPSYEVID